MKSKPNWLKIDAILGKPNASLKAKMIIVSEQELGRWTAKHLREGYTITLTRITENKNYPKNTTL